MIRLEARDHASRVYLALFDKPAQDLLQIPATKLEHIKSKVNKFTIHSHLIHTTQYTN